ncbi:MAG: hypothetical protein LUQ25_09405 [Methanoregulaceae archaeon]|nr:hypothetical protein [Methanoregulaceae archaeon]
MIGEFHLSPDLRELIEVTEGLTGSEITLIRKDDAPFQGRLVDRYHTGADTTQIIFPSSVRGLLKDYIIGKRCLELLFYGVAEKNHDLLVLSFDRESAAVGMKQIYQDYMKDESTQHLLFEKPASTLFYLFSLFRETFTDVTWALLADIVIGKKIPSFRNAQVYYLLKESMRDMHSLESMQSEIPHRYFVMRNSVFYARDTILAYILSEFKLNPVINIPELQQFKTLDMRQMMDHRWSRSTWAHTKQVGDAMTNILKLSLTVDFERTPDEAYYREVFRNGNGVIARWLTMTAMQDWFRWEHPEKLREMMARTEEIERDALIEIFSE